MKKYFVILAFVIIVFPVKADELLKIPPEKKIETTLVIDKITETSGANEFGVKDIAIIEGIRIEQEDSFGNIQKIYVANDSDTKNAICQFAGYARYTQIYADFEKNAKLDSTAIRYDYSKKQFILDSNSQYALLSSVCINSRFERLPGKTRIAPPTTINYELHADKIERLLLPTGQPYVRIVNPVIFLSKPLLGKNSVSLVTAPYAINDRLCAIFGYQRYYLIPGVTVTVKADTNRFYLNLYTGGEWFTEVVAQDYFEVLTCMP